MVVGTRIGWTLLLGTLLVACGGRQPLECKRVAPSTGGFEEEKLYDHYEVAADSPETFTKAAVKARPFEGSSDATDATGLTETSLCLSWSMSVVPGECKITVIHLLHRVRITLPRWSRPANARAEWIDWETKYATKLAAHEEGHYAIATEGAHAAFEAVQTVTTAPTCEELAAKLNVMMDAQEQLIRQKQAEYDAVTKHGTVDPGT